MATDAPAGKKLAVLDWLLAQRVNVEAVDHVECTALHCAAALGEAQLAARLLKAGASPRARDAEGLTPLHLAARAAAAAVLQRVLEAPWSFLTSSLPVATAGERRTPGGAEGAAEPLGAG